MLLTRLDAKNFTKLTKYTTLTKIEQDNQAKEKILALFFGRKSKTP